MVKTAIPCVILMILAIPMAISFFGMVNKQNSSEHKNEICALGILYVERKEAKSPTVDGVGKYGLTDEIIERIWDSVDIRIVAMDDESCVRGILLYFRLGMEEHGVGSNRGFYEFFHGGSEGYIEWYANKTPLIVDIAKSLIHWGVKEAKQENNNEQRNNNR